MSINFRSSFESVLEGQNGRVVKLKHPVVLFLAQNMDGRASLLARLPRRPGQILQDGRGFSVGIARTAGEEFIRITSTEPGFNIMFLKLVDYVLERTRTAVNELQASELFVTAIDEFRRFTQRKPGRLSEKEIRGLTGELLLILELVNNNKTTPWEIFSGWGGPFGAKYDFSSSSGSAIEVKTCHRPASSVRISSPEQIQIIPEGLDLAVLPLERAMPGDSFDVSFMQLVDKVATHARISGGEILAIWEEAINSLGLDIADEYYEQWTFHRSDWLRYSVEHGFPVIEQSSIPNGIINISYTLQLAPLDKFKTEFSEIEF